MRSFLLALAAVVSLWAIGCGIPDIENRVTITQGVYGQLISGCDTPGCSDRPITSGDVAVFDAPPPIGPLSVAPVARTALDGAGFYQLPVAPGRYWLAWVADGSSGPQIQTSIAEIVLAEGITRWDFVSGPGGGSWDER